jgi:DNA-binding response OmpR family regulator
LKEALMPAKQVSRVLVIDDEPDLRELLVDALSDEHTQVSVAASGAEAIDIISAEGTDFIVTDLMLGDCSGLDVLDEVIGRCMDIPAVLISGHGSAEAYSEASKRRPVELMNKPLDLDRLRATIREELARRRRFRAMKYRTQRLRRAANKVNRKRKYASGELESTCEHLDQACQALTGHMSFQGVLLEYQQQLIAAASDDDVFRDMFRLFARTSGPLFGVSMVVNSEAQLRIAGRFGVPEPDGMGFCERLVWPIVETVMLGPKVLVMDLSEDAETFDEPIRRYLAGVTVLAIPLMPEPGKMIGLAVLYRKGEQPFTESDLSLAGAISAPTALAIGRNC